MKIRPYILLGCLLLLLGSCKHEGSQAPSTRVFPEVRLPAMLPQEEMADYALDHFWDAYLDTTGRYLCDSTHIGGGEGRIVATQLASYLSILEGLPAERAEGLMAAFFDQLSRDHAADTSSNVFSWMAEAVGYYLYDPNSDIRSEELYLPFISRLAVSPYAPASLQASYAHAAEVCATNRIGTKAPDFRFRDAQDRTHTLYSRRSPWTVLLFVNPGCQACEDVVSVFDGAAIRGQVAAGRLQILGIYIDEDIADWKARSAQLPSHWTCGYDPDGVIRADRIYYVRAIPSIYLLDADKRIVLKDATPQAIAAYVDDLMSNNEL